jgi:hypothetical protein
MEEKDPFAIQEPSASGTINISSLPARTAAILSRVLPEGEIEETTHMPIHRGNCKECIQFALHVTGQTQGGASEILIRVSKSGQVRSFCLFWNDRDHDWFLIFLIWNDHD